MKSRNSAFASAAHPDKATAVYLKWLCSRYARVQPGCHGLCCRWSAHRTDHWLTSGAKRVVSAAMKFGSSPRSALNSDLVRLGFSAAHLKCTWYKCGSCQGLDHNGCLPGSNPGPSSTIATSIQGQECVTTHLGLSIASAHVGLALPSWRPLPYLPSSPGMYRGGQLLPLPPWTPL